MTEKATFIRAAEQSRRSGGLAIAANESRAAQPCLHRSPMPSKLLTRVPDAIARIRKFIKLPAADRWLLASAIVSVVKARATVTFVPVRTILQPLAPGLEGEAADRIAAAKISWAVETAGRIVPTGENCLVKAIAGPRDAGALWCQQRNPDRSCEKFTRHPEQSCVARMRRQDCHRRRRASRLPCDARG